MNDETTRASFLRRYAIRLAVPLVLAVLCRSTASHSADAGAPSASSTPRCARGPSHRNTLPILADAAAPLDSSSPAATGTIFAVKLYVGDVGCGEDFYGAVFGTTLAYEIGDNAHVVTFPDGGPLMILLKAGPHDRFKKGSFIVKVPNLDAALALAVGHGARVQGEFSGNPGGLPARSVDVLDPWGNQVEILQIG